MLSLPYQALSARCLIGVTIHYANCRDGPALYFYAKTVYWFFRAGAPNSTDWRRWRLFPHPVPYAFRSVWPGQGD